MIYTLKDLKEGKCAVANDGTNLEIETVLNCVFTESKPLISSHIMIYYKKPYKQEWVYGDIFGFTKPIQSVSLFYKQIISKMV
jgi:hypothetical protein